MAMTARPGSWSLRANGTLMARKINNGSRKAGELTPYTGCDLDLSSWSG